MAHRSKSLAAPHSFISNATRYSELTVGTSFQVLSSGRPAVACSRDAAGCRLRQIAICVTATGSKRRSVAQYGRPEGNRHLLAWRWISLPEQMLRNLHKASATASPRALWLGVVSQLGSDTSALTGCRGSATHQASHTSTACAPLRASLQTGQRSIFSVAERDDDSQMQPSSHAASDIQHQSADQQWPGAALCRLAAQLPR